ncbi:polysaccharide pyruvyl transferase family protein [Brevibacterium aurantiacum]|uniref:polysaccharide pyruvyl transferase family protein n=1 Tax=Brevibacterium aurantiacum TaxID=273384 RepID=UPI0000510533|nr:polysaccharide pyruvyl transferase family protein [Brevibacterium aurantiacum]
MTPGRNAADRYLSKGRELVKPVVHGIARRALPVVERASGTKYVRERATGAGKSSGKPKKIATETARAYRKLASGLHGATAENTDGWTVAPSTREVDAKARQLARLKAHAALSEALTQGSSFGPAVVKAGRSLVAAGHLADTVSVGLNLRSNPSTEEAGRVLLGLAYQRSSDPEVAWAQFEKIEDREIIVAAAEEYYPTAIDTLGHEALPLLESADKAGETDKWSAKAVLRTAESAFCIDAFDQVRTLVEARLDRMGDDADSAVRYELNRMRDWLPGGKHLEPLPTTAGKRNFGVLSYDQPGIRSRNIGDYIQTIASIGHLLRYENLSFTGDNGLTDLFAKLRQSVKEERKYGGPEAELNLVEVYRDGNVYQDIPEDTWYIAFGWYMHDIFGKSFNIPFHPNLRPILLSVFVRYPEMLTPEAVAYLKKYGPVGCRDWQSVAVLRAVGVPAFFSGCLTTTVDTLFPTPSPDRRSGTLRVDWTKDNKGPKKKQTVTAIRDKSFPENLELARNWVADYAYKYKQVLTSRLHANLPARSVGADVEFEPKNKSDSRFGGLIGINEDEFDAIRNGILDKLSVLLPLIATGASVDEIYSKWVEITADDMVAADDYLATAHLPEADSAAVAAVVAAAEKPTPENNVTDIVMTVDKGEQALVASAVNAIDGRTSTRYRVWLPAGALDPTHIDDIASHLTNGTIRALPPVTFPGVTNSNDLVQALLPELFPDHERLVVIPAAAEVRTDIAELAATDLDEALLAAKHDVRKNRSSGLTLMRRTASAFGDDHVGALKYVFASHAEMNDDFAPFDPQIAVLNPSALREDGVTQRVIGLLSEVTISFVDALLTVVRGRYADRDGDWNVRAQWETSADPKIVNWRGQTRHYGHMALSR